MDKFLKNHSATSVELWVVMTTLLLVVRFLIDFSGPYYSNMLRLTTVRLIELINYHMVHYTLALMQISPSERVNDYFQVWAVLMVTLQYSVKVGRPYGRSKQIPLLDLTSSIWAANLLRVQTVFLLKIPLWFIWSVNAARIIAYFLFADMSETRNKENARLVCDYMRYEHTHSATTDANNMSGYKYLVFGEDQQEMKSEPVKYTLTLDVEHRNLITLEKTWGLNDSGLLSRATDPEDQLKDVCLSFALYKLLRRRFYNFPIHEAEHDKTKKLVFEGILKGKDDDYERVFRITCVELSFLHDMFHSKHAQMFSRGFPFASLLLSLVLVAATGYIAYPVRQIHHRTDPADLNRNNITHGVSITYFIVGLIIAKEMAEIIMYVFSQWTMVQMICMHIKYPRFGRCWPVVKAIRCMFRLIRKGKWKHKIGQYNILISSHQVKVILAAWLFPTSIKLETEVKKAILESLKDLERRHGTCKGLDQNPERSEAYFSNAFRSKGDLMQQLEWAIDMEADTHRILVWHVATCLCEISLSDETHGLKTFWLKPRPFVNRSSIPEGVWEHYITASSLSNYCAYLLIKELVPDNGLIVNRVFHTVRLETNHATFRRGFNSLVDIYNSLMRNAKEKKRPKEEESEQLPVTTTTGHDSVIMEQVVGQEDEGEDYTVEEEDPEKGVKGAHSDEDTIIRMGTRLGKQLMERYEADRIGLWADLAKVLDGIPPPLGREHRFSEAQDTSRRGRGAHNAPVGSAFSCWHSW